MLALNDISRAVFSSGEENLAAYLLNVLRQLITALRPESKNYLRIEKEFLFSIYTTVQSIHNTFVEEHIAPDNKLYLQIIGKILQGVSIPFSGEPLEGMQIMGLMETRMLDFKNLVLLSVNEGVIPKGGHIASFIPYNLRVGFGLPTPEHQDALFSYYFYRLLQRAEHVKLLYTDSTRGLNSGEMSRFLYQMKYESGLPIREIHFQNNISTLDASPIAIPKTPDIIKQLDRYTLPDGKGLSPSSLNTYMECRLKFYFKYVAKIKEKEEIAEELDYRLLGTIFHESVQSLYATLPDGDVTTERIEALLRDTAFIDEHIRASYARVYDSATFRILSNGTNELVLAVVKKYVKKVFEFDKSLCPFHLVAMERTYRMPVAITDGEGISRTVYIEGNIDRVDRMRLGTRVIDYKTGADRVDFKDLASIFDPLNKQRNKAAFQTLLYCMMYEHENPDCDPILPGIYSTKLLFTPQYDYAFKCGKEPVHRFRPLEAEFRELLGQLLRELFSPEVSFSQTELTDKCRTCPYAGICKRG